MTAATSTGVAPSVTQIDPSDHASIAKCTTIIAESFITTPTTISMISDIDQLPFSTPHDVIDSKRLLKHYEDKIRRLVRDGATMVQSGDWSAVAIWEPPGFKMVGAPANRSCALRDEWEAKANIIEAKYLGEQPQENKTHEVEQNNNNDSRSKHPKLRPHWHLSFLARNPSKPPVLGAISAVVRPFLARAITDEVPIWLEATSLRGVEIYKHFGFRFLEKVTIGAGRYGNDGWPEDGGSGANAWVMIFDQHVESPT